MIDIVRRYKKLDWFDFVDRLTYDLDQRPSKELYFELLDEIRMRKMESVSEGGTYKLKSPTKKLLEDFVMRCEKEQDFATEQELNEFKDLAEFTL